MPHLAPHPCRAPRCAGLTHARYCDRHQDLARAEEAQRIARKKARERSRPSTTARGYGRAWQKLRLEVLKAMPVCPCGVPATEVDHVVPRRQGGTDHPSNLGARCRSCHSRKTALTDGRWGRRTPRGRGV